MRYFEIPYHLFSDVLNDLMNEKILIKSDFTCNGLFQYLMNTEHHINKNGVKSRHPIILKIKHMIYNDIYNSQKVIKLL